MILLIISTHSLQCLCYRVLFLHLWQCIYKPDHWNDLTFKVMPLWKYFRFVLDLGSLAFFYFLNTSRWEIHQIAPQTIALAKVRVWELEQLVTLCVKGLKTPTATLPAKQMWMIACSLPLKGEEVLPHTVLHVPDVTARNNTQRCRNFWLPQCLCLHVCLMQRTSGNLVVRNLGEA